MERRTYDVLAIIRVADAENEQEAIDALMYATIDHGAYEFNVKEAWDAEVVSVVTNAGEPAAPLHIIHVADESECIRTMLAARRAAPTSSFRCACGHDQEIEYEVDGYKVLDVRTEDGELKCEVCGEAFDRDAVYTAVSIDHAGNMTDAAADYEPADR